jgi:hypothetical protein
VLNWAWPAQADVAQLVEQPIRNRQVSGSSPLVGSILFSNFPALVSAIEEHFGEHAAKSKESRRRTQ